MQRKLQAFFSGEQLRRLISNALVLLSGGMLVSLLGVLSIAFVARELGPETFGVFALVTSTVLVIDRLVNFQSWQAVVRFASMLERDDRGAENVSVGVSRLILGCFMFDVGTALVGGLLASFSIYLLSDSMDWGADVQLAGTLYGLVVAVKISGTALGIFRLIENYWGQVHIQLAASSLKLGLVVLGVFKGWEFTEFLLIWAGGEIVMHLGLTILAFRQYKAHRGLSVFGYGADFRGDVVRFMLWTNLAVAADLPAKELDVIVVGLLAGEREAGFYKMARQGMALVGKLSSPLYQAVYPVQSRLLAGNKRFEAIKISLQASALLLLFSVVLVLFSWPVLPFAVPYVLGEEYAALWTLILFAVIVKSLDNIFTTVHSLFVAFGYVRANLLILLFANSGLLLGFWYSVPDYGAYAALSCLAVQAILVLVLKVVIITRFGNR